MELTSLKGSLVGLPGHSGLSVEQRKRLTIGVELVANPSIVFMVRACISNSLLITYNAQSLPRYAKDLGSQLLLTGAEASLIFWGVMHCLVASMQAQAGSTLSHLWHSAFCITLNSVDGVHFLDCCPRRTSSWTSPMIEYIPFQLIWLPQYTIASSRRSLSRALYLFQNAAFCHGDGATLGLEI